MSTIEKDELFDNLRQFLKGKGVELAEGSYTQTIQKSCRILADVINMGQSGIERAKTGIDKKLDQVRQCIHEKTAPKPPKTTSDAEPAVAPGPAAKAETTAAAAPETPPAAHAASQKPRATKAKPAAASKGKGSAKAARGKRG